MTIMFQYYQKKYKIFDANDNLVYNVYGSFIDFCKENKLPIDALKNSHRNNGKRIYTTLGSNEKRLNDNGMLKYKGWYAIRAE